MNKNACFNLKSVPAIRKHNEDKGRFWKSFSGINMYIDLPCYIYNYTEIVFQNCKFAIYLMSAMSQEQ